MLQLSYGAQDSKDHLAGWCASSEAIAASGVKAIYKRDLPPVSLNGWQVTVLELTCPPGTTSPKHSHPGFILGYILEGEYRFQLEGEPEKVLSTGDVFYGIEVLGLDRFTLRRSSREGLLLGFVAFDGTQIRRGIVALAAALEQVGR